MTSIRHLLLVDECLPPALITVYLQGHIGLSGDGVDAIHIRDRLGSGKKDPAWVPEIARDRRWCILSTDRGSHSSRQDALPLVCYEYKVTLIRVSQSLIDRGITFYGPQILANWGSVVEALKGPKGAQYLLRRHGRKTDVAFLTATRAPSGFEIVDGALVKLQPAEGQQTKASRLLLIPAQYPTSDPSPETAPPHSAATHSWDTP